MSRFEDVQQFVHEANRISDIGSLRSLLDSTIRDFGFDYYALIHHVNGVQRRDDVVCLHNYPQAWVKIIASKGYFLDDPVLAACQKSAAPFTWTDVPKIIRLTDRQSEIFSAARAAGMGDGFAVPINIPGEYGASSTFSTHLGRDLPAQSFYAVSYIGSFAFETARKIMQRQTAKKDVRLQLVPQPKLTSRQLECVALAGRGKSDKDVGRILGISDQTVHEHIEAAKRQYNVATRMQLVVRALFDSQLSFVDLVK